MGIRSNDHQLVAGKQYFNSDVQFGAGLQGAKNEIITATDGQTLTAEQSGATVVVGDNIAITLPTAAVGLCTTNSCNCIFSSHTIYSP